MTTGEDAPDIVVFVGTGVLGAWVSEFIRQAYYLSERTIDIHYPDDAWLPEELGRRKGGHPRAVLATEPGRPLMDVLADRIVPVVAVLDDPVDSVRYAMATRGDWDFHEALRRQVRNAMAHHLLFENPAVMLVTRGTPKPARGVLGAIMGHIGLRVRADEEAGLLERLAGTEEELLSVEEALATRVTHHARLDRLKDLVSADDATLIRQALSPLVHGAVSRDVGPVTWAIRTLMSGDAPGTPAPAVADITGGARILFYGPYFHLPPGEWSVRIIVAFSDEVRGMPFRLILFAGERAIARVAIKPAQGGAYEGVFTARHVDADQRVEIQFINDEATIDGHVALGQLTFTRVGTVSSIDHRDE